MIPLPAGPATGGPPVDALSTVGGGPSAGTEPNADTGSGVRTRPRPRTHSGSGPGVAMRVGPGVAMRVGPGVAVPVGPGVAMPVGPGVAMRTRSGGGATGTGPRTGPGGSSSGGEKPDRGASTLELALLTPILLLVILLVVQFAMVYHARHVALAAAQSGARVAREQSRGDWKGEAESTAREYVQRIGPALLTSVDPQAGGDRNQRWVTVTGTAVRVVPFLTFHVSQRSGGPIECYRPDVGAGTTCQDQPQP